MTEHTPAPWEVHPNKMNVFTGTPTPNGRIAVADCKIGRSDERKANARLIAAAPELLEALQEAQDHLEYCGYGDNWERECAQEAGLAKKIEDAIAKATGETS